MKQNDIDRAIKKAKQVGDVSVVTMPLNRPGYTLIDGVFKYIFINSKVPSRQRREITEWGLKDLAERSKKEKHFAIRS